MAGFLRTPLIALLITTQTLSLAFALSTPASAGLCPAHGAQLSAAETRDLSQHSGHGIAGHHAGIAPSDPASDSEDETSQAAAFNFLCCIGHAAGIFHLTEPFDVVWSRTPSVTADPRLAAGELASVDPPPRPVL
jgi:hypothetical protein